MLGLFLLLLVLSSQVVRAEQVTGTAEEAVLGQLRPFAEPDYWQERRQAPVITREVLIKSIEGVRAYYLNNQFTAGNFLYALDASSGEMLLDADNETRQAGALWGLTCLLRERYTDQTRRAVLLALDFFLSNRADLPTGEKRIICYPGTQVIKTGTVALFCLSLTEFLSAQGRYLPEDLKQRYQEALEDHFLYLRNMELPNGGWDREYEVHLGMRSGDSLSYYDGEVLLAYCRAVRCLGKTELLPRIQESMPKLLLRYTADAWKRGGDAESAKGFSQWGAMSCVEYMEAGWGGEELCYLAAKALAWWFLWDNWTAYKSGNTSYAVEGLLACWRVCQLHGDASAAEVIREESLAILGRLMLLQVGGPFQAQNDFLQKQVKLPSKAFGGIIGGKDNSIIRIDVVQHQLHAMQMALNYLFPEK